VNVTMKGFKTALLALALIGVIAGTAGAQNPKGVSFYHLVVLNAEDRFRFPEELDTIFMWTHKKAEYPDGYTVVLFRSQRILNEEDFAGANAELLLYVASEWKSAIRKELTGDGAFAVFVTNRTIRQAMLEVLR